MFFMGHSVYGVVATGNCILQFVDGTKFMRHLLNLRRCTNTKWHSFSTSDEARKLTVLTFVLSRQCCVRRVYILWLNGASYENLSEEENIGNGL